MNTALSTDRYSSGDFVDGAPSIRLAAELSDILSQHLAPSFEQTTQLDVVARTQANAALEALDALFLVEGRRFAFFRDPISESDEEAAIEAGRTEALSRFFEDPDLTLLGSMLNLSDQALAWSLSNGLQPMAWNEKTTLDRDILIGSVGGALPIAYLLQAYNLGIKNMRRRLKRDLMLPDHVISEAVSEIGRSVAIEVVRAGVNAGEKIETLAIWCLGVQPFDGKLLVHFLMRGSFHTIHTLLATVSARQEEEIRSIRFDGDIDAMERLCRDCGLPEGYGRFMLEALDHCWRIGPAASAAELIEFSPRMAAFIAEQADEEDAPDAVLELAISGSDHLTWTDGVAVVEEVSHRTAEIVAFPVAS